jgi:predicted RecB family nuclease
MKGILKTCKKGHQFHKSSDCPACPICEDERKPKDSFLALIGAPARRALERENIKTLVDLAKYSEKEILSLHGVGKTTIPKLKKLLTENGQSFKTESNGK